MQYKTISFDNVIESAVPMTGISSDEINAFKVVKKEIGVLETREIRNETAQIIEYKSQMDEHLRVQHDEARMLNCINICFIMEGSIGLHLPKRDYLVSLSDFQHHHIFVPEPRYDLLVSKSVHGYHFSIDREYYTDLLCEQDNATKDVREKLMKRDLTYSGRSAVNTFMRQSLSEIFSNPLQGKLKSMFVEGKVLELIAMQLGQFSADNIGQKRSDVDVFYDIRKFLEQNFKEDLSLKGIARTFGLNEFKLKKGFKTTFNTTIFDYIHDLKMIHANLLLRDAGMYVNEVSSIVGYKNPNHFSTAFKRKFGVSPSSIK